MVILCHAFLQADNTVREAKNRFVLSWLHLQCIRNHFRTVTLAMPRKSHSHDRIGRSHLGWPVSIGMCLLAQYLQSQYQCLKQLSVSIFNVNSSLSNLVEINFGGCFHVGWATATQWWMTRQGPSLKFHPVVPMYWWSWQDMVKILQDECRKPGLKNWVGLNTEIRVRKLNVPCQGIFSASSHAA